MITTDQDDLDSKPNGSLQLSKYQAGHKNYIKYWQAKKHKPPDKESTVRKPKKRNLGKNKCFICYDKGHFAKAFPKP